ncbi:MAG TPA: single-stranded-DNA-specific exonuclease RecJ [Planctomycetaceae bacterium]|nr:single-stranded-DNA-specific exonuclease RecJ [Planctomycetaceae bacterium]
MSHTAKSWLFRPFDRDRILSLAKSAKVHAVLAQLLLAREIGTPEEMVRFFGERIGQPPSLNMLRSPSLLPGCVEVADRLSRAILEKRKIVVYGDYDADGMTATAILCRAIRFFGGTVDFYVPDRMEEGYGLNAEAIRALAGNGTQVIITVDCGINSCDEARLATELGVELLITDHHTVARELPEVPIVHPQLVKRSAIDATGNDRWSSPYGISEEERKTFSEEKRYPFLGLSGAGVAFKVAWRLGTLMPGGDPVGEKVSEGYRTLLCRAVGLAAIGTVADVVPLLDENRALVRFGLHVSLVRFPVPGLEALMKTAQLDARKRRLSAEDLGFSLGPLLNAAGRLNKADRGVRLLLSDDPGEAASLAAEVREYNETRQSIERSILIQATRQVEERFSGDPALVLSDSGWHPGVIGIVAGRLAERFHRPCILIAEDTMNLKPGSGSGRGARGINLVDALETCSEYLVRFGGHAAAAGLRIESRNIGAFRKAFCEYVRSNVSHEDVSGQLMIDAECPFGLLDEKTSGFADLVEHLAPFGAGNPKPLFCASRLFPTNPRFMGVGEHHICMELRQDNVVKRAFAFQSADWLPELREIADAGQAIDAVFHIGRSKFNNAVELQLKDWRRYSA